MSSGLGWPDNGSPPPERVGWPQDAAVAELDPSADDVETGEAPSTDHLAPAQPPPLPTGDVSRETTHSIPSAQETDQVAVAQDVALAQPPPLPTGDVSRETISPTVGEQETDEAPLAYQPAPPPPLPPGEVGDVSRETDHSIPGVRETDDSAVTQEVAPAQPPPLPPVDVSRETSLLEGEPPVDPPPMTAAEVSPPAPLPAVDLRPASVDRGPWPRPPHRRVMTVANQKGGVGKTTSAVNMAAALALNGVRVLLIDLDPQGNASTAFSVAHPAGTPSVYDVLIGEVPLAEVSVPVEGISNLWCAPATIDLAGAEIELVSVVARESRLRRALDSVPDLDYVFIDCPPSLGLLTLNAMVAASELLIPIQCEFYALEGLSQLLNNVELVKKHLNADLAISTVLLTMYDARTRLAEQVASEVRAHFGGLVIDSVIPRSVRISEAPGFGQPVVTFDPTSRGARAYFDAAYDLAQRGVSTQATDEAVPREEGQA